MDNINQQDKKIANLLLKKGSITRERYDDLLLEAAKVALPVDFLLEEHRLVSEEEIAKVKSDIFSLPYAEIYGLIVDKEVLKILPRELAETYQIVVFGKEDSVIKVAMLNPGDFKAQEVIEFITKPRNLKVKYFTTTFSGLKNILSQYGGLAADVEEVVEAVSGEEGSPLLTIGDDTAQIEVGKEGATSLASAPVAKMVSSIFKYGVDNRASDIHIEPLGEQTRVRYRIDGALRTRALLPGNLHSAIISRVKVMANLKLDETRVPQDGRIRLIIMGRKIDFRISTLPLLDKEKVVMRILDPAQKIYTLEDLGFWGRGARVIKRNLQKPHGMFLVTGPTGSGKTTTLYAVLKILNKQDVNIVTLEDPIEYYMEGVNQSQVKPDIGYSFASGLRSLLRQDPNVMMIGEIRDNETAGLAIHAALTGHIVLSTLHTNDAFGAIPRLIDMKIEPFLISSSLNIVLSQRLVRKICEYCKEEIAVDDSVQQTIETVIKKIPNLNIDEYRDKATGKFKLYRGKGCIHCNKEGHKGRTAIFEVLEVTEQLTNIIHRGSNREEIKKEFARQQMIDLVSDGYIKAVQGIITLEEVLRTAQD
ncbi:MAG: GspE/PulE family protein [Patescibacteria group bacterium]